jgi:hypothetical protein
LWVLKELAAKGPHAFGGVTKYAFNEEGQTVLIQVNAVNCLNEPYLSLKNAKSANWDFAIWDTAIWE